MRTPSSIATYRLATFRTANAPGPQKGLATGLSARLKSRRDDDAERAEKEAAQEHRADAETTATADDAGDHAACDPAQNHRFHCTPPFGGASYGGCRSVVNLESGRSAGSDKP